MTFLCGLKLPRCRHYGDVASMSASAWKRPLTVSGTCPTWRLFGSWPRARELSFECPEIPIVAPRGDLAVTQLKYAHARHADAIVSDLEMVHAFGHYDIVVGHDVINFPR